MPLEDLLELVETLRKRIGEHGPLLSQNEIRTRYALIDPLLWGVGWDTEDPAQVVPEYALAPKSADYALLGSDGRPAMIVEAKKLDRPLRDGLSQSIAYCVEQGTPYFCVTDGRRWAIYETFRQVPVDKKLVTEFDVLKDSPAEVCLKALALWRPAVDEGLVREGETPLARGATESTVIEEQVSPQWECPECGEAFAAEETRRIARHKQQHTLDDQPGSPPPTAPPDGDKAWIRLSESDWKARTTGRRKPEALQLPSGEQKLTRSWPDFIAALAQWVVDMGHLSEASEPIRAGREKYVLARTPVNPDGSELSRPRQAGPLYIGTNYSGADTIRNAQLIVKQAKLEPTDFKVRLAD